MIVKDTVKSKVLKGSKGIDNADQVHNQWAKPIFTRDITSFKELAPWEPIADIAEDWEKYKEDKSVSNFLRATGNTVGNIIRLSPYGAIAGRGLVKYGSALTKTHPIVGKVIGTTGKYVAKASDAILKTTAKTATKVVATAESYVSPLISALAEAVGTAAIGYGILATGVKVYDLKDEWFSSRLASDQMANIFGVNKNTPIQNSNVKLKEEWNEFKEKPLKYIWDIITFKSLKGGQ